MPHWIKFVVALLLLTTIANIGILSYLLAPQRPVAASKELFDHPGFKKAVESIAQAKGYLTEAEVEKIVEHCRVMTGGKINCD